MKGGIGWNLRISDFERYLYLMFLSREIDIKLCQNYTKTGISQILYKSYSIKQIKFNNYATNLKTTCWKSQVCSIYNYLIFILHFIITFYPYSPYYVTSTSANGSAVYWSHDYCLFYVTKILHCHWLKLLWRNTDCTAYM